MAKATPLPGGSVRGSKTGRPIMALLDLTSRRWLLCAVWELRGGPLKFRPLQAACGGPSPSILNTRLRELRGAKLIELTIDGYQLTPLGHGLCDAFVPLSTWSKTWAEALKAPGPKAETSKTGRPKARAKTAA